jgi:trk system potassium uptake protein TrkH
MHWSAVLRVVSLVTLLIGAAMLVPLATAAVLGEADLLAFALAVAAATVPAGILALALRGRHGEIGRREGMLIVTLSWVSASVFGALPFWFFAHLQDFAGLKAFTICVFETVSGYTTTGSTALADPEALPHALMLWRCGTQWLGGMGIVVLFLAILPGLGIGGQELFRAEVPGATKDKITPQLRDTARLLWIAYVGLSLAQVLALVLAGMGWFDSVCHTFTTMATGGFSTKNAGVMYWNSPAIEGVLIFFMAIAGMNFALHVKLFTSGDWRGYFRDAESSTYLLILAALTLGVALPLLWTGVYDTPGSALRHAGFQVVSLMTTTGYNSADFHQWVAAAPLTPVLLILAMFIGGCSGSTAGAIKVSRLIVATKHVGRELARLVHPRAVIPVRINGLAVPEQVVALSLAFILLYFVHYVLGVVLVAATGVDIVTSASAVAATLGNVGPGLAAVGPTANFGHLHPFALWVLTYEMFVGRLELLTAVALLTRSFWRR